MLQRRFKGCRIPILLVVLLPRAAKRTYICRRRNPRSAQQSAHGMHAKLTCCGCPPRPHGRIGLRKGPRCKRRTDAKRDMSEGSAPFCYYTQRNAQRTRTRPVLGAGRALPCEAPHPPQPTPAAQHIGNGDGQARGGALGHRYLRTEGPSSRGSGRGPPATALHGRGDAELRSND